MMTAFFIFLGALVFTALALGIRHYYASVFFLLVALLVVTFPGFPSPFYDLVKNGRREILVAYPSGSSDRIFYALVKYEGDSVPKYVVLHLDRKEKKALFKAMSLKRRFKGQGRIVIDRDGYGKGKRIYFIKPVIQMQKNRP